MRFVASIRANGFRTVLAEMDQDEIGSGCAHGKQRDFMKDDRAAQAQQTAAPHRIKNLRYSTK